VGQNLDVWKLISIKFADFRVDPFKAIEDFTVTKAIVLVVILTVYICFYRCSDD